MDLNARSRPIITMLILTLLAAFTPTAYTQVAKDFPQPMTTRQLEAHADRLSMSDEQRVAIQPAHDRYLAEYDRIQQQQIKTFDETYGDLRRVAITDASNLDSALRDLQAIVSGIATADDQLFAEMQQVLTAEQIRMLPRARDARQRERHMHLLTSLNDSMRGGARVDLTEIVAEVGLTTEQRAAIDGLLQQYEFQLTSRLRQQYSQMIGSFRTFVRELKSHGVSGDVDRSDRSEMRRLARVYEEVMMQQRAAIMEGAAEISRFNRRSARDLALSMETDTGRQFIGAYRRQAYPMAIGKSSHIDQRIAKAAEAEHIADDQRQAILGLAEQTWITREPVIEQVIDLFEESYAAGRTLDLNNRRRGRETEEQLRLAELTTRIGDINAAAIETLDQILALAEPSDQAATQKASDVKEGQRGEFQIIVSDEGGGSQIATIVRAFSEAETVNNRFVDTFLAAPMSRSDVEQVKRALPITEDQKMIVEALYGDYVATFETIDEQINQPLQEAQQESWVINGDAKRQVRPTEDVVNRRFDLRRAGLEQVLAADEAFFSDLGLLIDDDAAATVDLLRLIRQRDVYATPGRAPLGNGRWPGLTEGNIREWQIDLGRLVLSTNVTMLSNPKIVETLVAYENDTLPLLQEHYRAAMNGREAVDRGRIEPGKDMSPDDRRRMERDRWEDIRKSSESMQGFSRQIGEINLAARDVLLDLLGDEPIAYDLLDAYNRLAFPDVFKDGRSLLSVLNLVMKLPDLSDGQKQPLNELAGEYRSGYFAQCDRMIAIYRDFAEQMRDAEGRREQWELASEQRDEIERLEFQRNELSDKTRQRLRVLLTEAQLARVNELDLTDGKIEAMSKKGIIGK